MIIMIVKNVVGENKVIYEIIDDPKIIEFGKLLSKNQIKNLKNFGNTVIPYDIYHTLSESKLKAEIKELTGIANVKFKVVNHDDSLKTVIVEKVK